MMNGSIYLMWGMLGTRSRETLTFDLTATLLCQTLFFKELLCRVDHTAPWTPSNRYNCYTALKVKMNGGLTSSLVNSLQLLGGFATPFPGGMSVTPGTATSTRIDLNQIGEARNSMLGIKLDQVSVKDVIIQY